MNSTTRLSVARTRTLALLFFFVGVMWIVFFIDLFLFSGNMALAWEPDVYLGIVSRNPAAIPGIFTRGFFHADLDHLVSNSFAILFFGVLLAHYQPLMCRFMLVSGIIVPGALDWLIGESGSISIGASALGFTLVASLVTMMFLMGFRKGSPILIICAAFLVVAFNPLPFGTAPEVPVDHLAHILGYLNGIAGTLIGFSSKLR